MGTFGHKSSERHHLGIGKHRQQRFHPLSGNALTDLAQKLHEGSIARVLGGQGIPTLGDVLCNRQLTRRKNLHGADFNFGNSALVSDGELTNIGDLIAPKFHADRIVQGRGKDINNAAAHREFATLGHHIHA